MLGYLGADGFTSTFQDKLFKVGRCEGGGWPPRACSSRCGCACVCGGGVVAVGGWVGGRWCGRWWCMCLCGVWMAGGLAS
jgi:hypothetical protein